MSRLHASISWGDRGLMITDLQSRNGTTLNGRTLAPKEPAPLGDSAEIWLGEQRLILALATSAGPKPPGLD